MYNNHKRYHPGLPKSTDCSTSKCHSSYFTPWFHYLPLYNHLSSAFFKNLLLLWNQSMQFLWHSELCHLYSNQRQGYGLVNLCTSRSTSFWVQYSAPRLATLPTINGFITAFLISPIGLLTLLHRLTWFCFMRRFHNTQIVKFVKHLMCYGNFSCFSLVH